MVTADLELREIETPIGSLAVIAGPAGVSRVCYPGSDRAGAAAAEEARNPPGCLGPADLADRAAVQLTEWFDGERRFFDLPLDLGSVHGFQRRVLEAAQEIPFGETASYTEMAIAAGSPRAVRAAGTAMGANPLPILIPCHRVIRSDGSPGLYGGGEETKRWLLARENREAHATGDRQDLPAIAGIPYGRPRTPGSDSGNTKEER